MSLLCVDPTTEFSMEQLHVGPTIAAGSLHFRPY